MNTSSTTRFFNSIVFGALALVFSLPALAQTTVTLGGIAGGTCPFTPTAAWTTPPTGVTFSNLTRGSGVTCASASDGLSGSGFNLTSAANSFSSNRFYTVSLTAAATHTFTLNSITWLTTLSGTASGTDFTVQYRNDGGTLTTFGTAGQSGTTTNTFSGSVSVAAGKTIILYFIPFNASAATGTVRMRNGSTINITATAASAAPVISSGNAATLTYGTAYTTGSPAYTITASNSPTSYGGTGLPPGLSVNASGQVIGTPTSTAGSPYTANVTATNGGGAGNKNVTFTINKKALTISGISAQDKVFDGTTAATLTGTAALVGVIAGDAANVSIGGTPVASFADPNVGIGKPVTVGGYTISGSAAGNYSLTQPAGLTADITASGCTPPVTPTGVISEAPGCGTSILTHDDPSYFWQGTDPNGSDFSPAASTANPFTATAAGIYYVRAYNPAGGGCFSAASQSVVVTVNTAPAISTHPATQTVATGASVTFSVVATGTGLTYQWKKGGTDIPLATSDTYTIASATAGDAGNYTVIVSGTCSPAVTSNIAVLAVTAPDFINIAAYNTAYTQDFNGLPTSGSTDAGATGHLGSVVSSLAGWYFKETGTNANTGLIAGTGTANAGETYNFGSGTNRSLGGLRSGSLVPVIGAKLVNNTGGTITSLLISYTGQTWRDGTINRQDKLQFEYSTSASSISTGTFTGVTNLDYTNNSGSSVTGGSVLRSQNLSYTITGLNIASGAAFYIRWTDLEATSSDDGLSVDAFSVTALNVCSPPTTQASNITFSNISGGQADISWTAGSGNGRLVYINDVNSFSLPSTGLDPAVNTVWQNGSYQAIYNGAGTGPVTVTGLAGNTNYYIAIYEYCTPGRVYNITTATNNPRGFTTSGTIPALTTTIPTGITPTTAVSGGTITNNGGSAITLSGVVYDVNPTPTANPTMDGAPSGTYSSNLFALTPETQYYLRAYATNATGTGYGNEVSFYTLSPGPTGQASGLLASASSSSQIELTWDVATYPTPGPTFKGYVLLRATAPAMPTLASSNGTAPAAGVGTIVSSTIADPTALYSNTGLAANTTYNYLLVPFTWNGVHAGTCHYLTAGAPTASATTPPGACTEPTTQASGASLSGTDATSTTLSWSNGSGNRSLVVIRNGSPVTAVPVDGIAYTASPAYGGGDNLGTLQYVLHAGAATSVAITGLSPSTLYYVAVFTYDAAGSCYKTASPATNSVSTSAAATVIETFEPAVKAAYAAANTTGALGVWNFTDALIGTSSGNDRFNGTRSARIQNTGSITMQFDRPDGIGTITVRHARYGSDAASTWRLYVSDNGGATFDAYQSSIVSTSGSALATATIPVNLTGSLRIRISKVGGGQRLNVDDVSFTDFVSANTITTGPIGSTSFCISNTDGAQVLIPFTSTGAFGETNVYTAQLSDGAGDFSNPVEIGTLAGAAHSGVITGTIPAGTASGSGYRIRVLASDPALTGTQNSANLTIYLNTPDVSGLNASITGGTTLTLGWTSPTACFDQILVVSQAGSAITAIPAGNGTAYTANAAFGTAGTNAGLPTSEYALFKGTGNSVNVTGLTAGSLYYFKVFVRKGTLWSEGAQLAATPIAPQAGDYRSVTGTNLTYSSASTWQMYNGASWSSASSAPGANANVTIQSGSTVRLSTSASGTPIKNLTVNAGGKLYANDSTYSGNRYLTIYGDITCNGTIGNGLGRYDNISFNIEGNPTTISGVGTFNGSRLRKNFNTNTTSSLIIAMNVGLKFASGVGGSSGTVMYNNASGTTFDVTLNQNTTLNLFTSAGESGNLSIDGINGEGSGEMGGLFTINGTLNIPGTLFDFTDNNTRPVGYTIGGSGVINCVNVCTGNFSSSNPAVQNGSATAGATLRILSGGRLNMTGGSPANTNTYNKPFSRRNNTSAPYSYAVGLGTVRQTYDFQPGSIVEYSSESGIMPIQTSGLTYANLVISGGATSTLSSTLNVLGDLTIQLPARLDCNGQDITIGGNWSSYGPQGFDEGTTNKVTFNGTDAQRITTVGGERFNNLVISNSFTNGVELNSDVEVAGTLDLGSTGRLFFGHTPSVLRLSSMGTGNTLLGTGTALIDMSNAAHVLYIGCQAPNYTGTFSAGSASFVNYNRDNSLSGSGGSQDLMTSIGYANLYLSGSDAKNITDTVTVAGDLNVDGASTILNVATPGTWLTLGGDLKLTGGSFMHNNCLTNLDLRTTGAGPQVLFSPTYIPVHDLVWNNPSLSQLSADIRIGNLLSMQSGTIQTGSNDITLEQSAILLETDTSYVLGTVQATRTMSQGITETFGNMGFEVTAQGASPGVTKVVRKTGPSAIQTGYMGNTSISKMFDVTAAVDTGLNATLVIPYFNHELNSLQETTLKAFRSKDAGATWEQIMSSMVSPTAKTVTATNVPGFSFWTLGSEATPLPVVLAYFHGRVRSSNVVLEWKTVNEVATHGFYVEKSLDGKAFQEIGFVEAKQEPSQYSFTDPQLKGRAYYRLRITDLDGSIAYSSTIVLKTETTPEVGIAIAPNPTHSAANLIMEGYEGEVTILLTSVDGKRLKALKGSLLAITSQFREISKALITGMYHVQVTGSGFSKNLRLIKEQ